jgi:hypothetical protein
LFLGIACASSQPVTTHALSQHPQTTVYVTNTGKKYHANGCRHLAKSRIPMKLEEARKAGYEPCKVCRPPQ